MRTFSSKDVENYYDQTEVHYRMFWKLRDAKGLHYGIWENHTRNVSEAILNTNYSLMKLGEIQSSDHVLDCGCGIGGSAIYLAKKIGCKVTGITLSARQVATAQSLAGKEGVQENVDFYQKDYLNTGFPDATFNIVWAIESFGSAPDKGLFFKEMHRILKPGGKILYADTFKPYSYNIDNEPDMQIMLNGWAISDILSIDELKEFAVAHDFEMCKLEDVSKQINKSVNLIYWAALAGMIGTKLYNLFKRASYYSRIHYKTGIAQKRTYVEGKWGYYLVVCKKG
jgi:tocopherol O-methyltransferase